MTGESGAWKDVAGVAEWAVIADVDVVIVGGSTAAVSCALLSQLDKKIANLEALV